MKNLYFKFFILLMMFISQIGFSQTNEIRIKFIGNAALHMTDGNLDVYIDFPYKSGAYNYMEYDASELQNIDENSILIFTHKHADHYLKKLLKKFKSNAYGPWNIKDLQALSESIPDFDIQAFKTEHKVFGISFPHYSYVITWHQKKIYISGDTGDLELARNLKDIEWSFINPWLFMNAQDENLNIDSKKMAIYHLYPTQELPTEVPDYIVFLKDQGEVFRVAY